MTIATTGAVPAAFGQEPPSVDVEALLAARGHEGLELLARHLNPAMAGVLRTIGFDAEYVRGEGAYLFDAAGNRYIDCLGGYAVFALGRNHPGIRAALKQAMDLDLPNLPGVGTPRLAGLLAEELLKTMPRPPATAAREHPSRGPLETVFFANSGAEAMDAAIKHARIATRRSRILHCARSYHGLTMGALSACGNKEFCEGFGPLLESTEVPFGDAAALERELARGDAAAFIVEPIQGKGVNIPPDDYLARSSSLCTRHGAVLILDEVQTGLGRTGRMWGCEHFGGGQTWSPDILVTAKALSGGYVPVSAVVSAKWISRAVFPSMSHCSKIQTTFGGNDLAMAAGLATLAALRAERIVERAGDVGDYLVSRLREALAGMEMVKDIRGRGLMIAVEFQPPRSRALRVGWDLLHSLDQSLFCQAVIMPLMARHRILAQVAGHGLDVIKLIPPLVLSREDADEIAAAFKDTVGACHRFPGPAWEVGRRLGAAAVKRFT